MVMKRKAGKPDLGAAPKEIIKEAYDGLDSEGRRVFLKQTLTLGAMVAASGVVLSGPRSVQAVLDGMSRWNDRAQGWLFDPDKLAPEYPRSMITKPFPFNAYYDESEVPVIDGRTYKLELGGLVRDKRSWTLDALYKLPQVSQVTRHICVEGWSAIGEWGGVPLGHFLKRIGADTTAKYVGFQCADGYYTSLDMPSALHPQTLLSLSYAGKVLPVDRGYPVKIRVATKLGFKNPKHVVGLWVTNKYPGGYWEDQGYNWFSGS